MHAHVRGMGVVRGPDNSNGFRRTPPCGGKVRTERGVIEETGEGLSPLRQDASIPGKEGEKARAAGKQDTRSLVAQPDIRVFPTIVQQGGGEHIRVGFTCYQKDSMHAQSVGLIGVRQGMKGDTSGFR